MLVLLPVLFELTFVYKLSTDLNRAESSLTEIMQERDTLAGGKFLSGETAIRRAKGH